ncbi:MAG: diadenylate cyclase [Candidatus Omnitrophota bacterium]
MISMVFKYIKDFIQNVRIADIIDVGIISVFIYLVLVWFKRARARFMLLGMIILGSIYVLARLFGLYLTTIVFQAFLAIFLIILVVIFQDDFRQFFERIAVWGISRRLRRVSAYNQDINILTSAVANLSRKQIGALIVIRGRDPLDRHIEAGISLDGLLSQALIESIFDPHVPSHDGAVVISGKRIVKFAAHLPLSTNVEEIGNLGTRHAAGVGITERSDSISIVISEEKSTISVAENGILKQVKEPGELNGLLERFYRKRFPERRKTLFMDFLTGHYLEKIIAFILACGLWLTFGHRTGIIRRDFVIPIEYRNLASDVIIEEARPRQVSATLSGAETAFSLLAPKELKVSVDASGVKDGENQFSIGKEAIRTPAGLSVVNIDPDEIFLKVYRKIVLNIPVEINTYGRPSSGVTIREIRAEPKEISITVSSTIEREKIKISTAPINLKAITETTTLTPELILSPDLRFSGDKYPEVKVIIDVEKK